MMAEKVGEVRAGGLSRVTIWRRVRDGDFPSPIRLGGPKTRAVGWRRSEIEDWLKALGQETEEGSQQTSR